jgi:hypothetical protein
MSPRGCGHLAQRPCRGTRSGPLVGGGEADGDKVVTLRPDVVMHGHARFDRGPCRTGSRLVALRAACGRRAVSPPGLLARSVSRGRGCDRWIGGRSFGALAHRVSVRVRPGRDIERYACYTSRNIRTKPGVVRPQQRRALSLESVGWFGSAVFLIGGGSWHKPCMAFLTTWQEYEHEWLCCR